MTPQKHQEPNDSPHVSCVECGKIKQQIQTLDRELERIRGDLKKLSEDYLTLIRAENKTPIEPYTNKVIIALISTISIIISTIGNAIITVVMAYFKGEFKLP